MPSRCSFLLLLFTVVALTVNAVRVAAASDITPASPEATTQPATTAPAAPATQLTHPGTKSFSLLRSSGGNTKATMLAAAGNKNAQRLLRVQAHTAKVEAEYRRMNPMAVDHITFSDGCPFSDFLVPTLVGSTVAHLLIDTGSATLALAGQQCANCQGVTPLWQQTNTATNQNIAADGTYGDGSGWVGNIWSDRVAFADATTSQPVTAYVQTNVVVMTSQSKNGVDASGNSNPNSQPFFFNNPCNDASPAERATVFSQGIIGIGPQAIAADNTDSFMMKLLSSSGDPTLERSFAIRMCEDGGDLWIGGSDASTYVAAPLYTPLSGPFFGVTPTAALLDGKAVPGATFPAPSPNYISAVDSGTTYWTLPPAVHDGIISSLNANAAFSKFFSAGFWTDDSGRCLTPKADPTTGAVPTLAQMQAEMPTLTITFASGLSVTMDGIGSYIMPCSKRYNSFTPGIFSDGGSDGQFELSIWGWAFMNQFIVHHDLANNRLGFSVRKGCSSGNPSNRAAVYAGSAPPASGTGSGTGTGSSSSTGGSDVCVPTPGVICGAEKLAGSMIIAAFLMIIAIVQQRLL